MSEQHISSKPVGHTSSRLLICGRLAPQQVKSTDSQVKLSGFPTIGVTSMLDVFEFHAARAATPCYFYGAGGSIIASDGPAVRARLFTNSTCTAQHRIYFSPSLPLSLPPSSMDHETLATESNADCSNVRYAGAFFPQSQNLRVSGGIFTSHVHVTAPTQLDDFKKIARWEIDLRREIRMDQDRKTVCRSGAKHVIGRVFSAKVQSSGSKSVILYEGATAEEECLKYISWHANIWHPNVLQIFGLSSFAGKHAVIAQDDLLPYDEYLKVHRPSFVAEVFLHLCWRTDLFDVQDDLPGIWPDHTLWIRGSTGRLCIDFAPRKIQQPFIAWMSPLTRSNTDARIDWHDPAWEARALDCLSVDDFHQFCSRVLAKHRILRVDPDKVADIHLGAVLFSPLDGRRFEDYIEIAWLPTAQVWDGWDGWNGAKKHICDNGWTRFHSMDVCGDSIGCMWAPLETDRLSWIEHANNLFEKLQITGSQEHFGFTDQIHLYFDVAVSTEDPPDGYLFLCPREHFFPGATGSFVWPECPYFWSVDETGVERLRPEDASARGFPTIDLRMEVIGAFWDGTVYERVRKFHELKGYVTEIQTPPVWEISWANGLMPKMVPSEDTAQSVPPSENSHPETDSFFAPLWDWMVPEFGSLC